MPTPAIPPSDRSAHVRRLGNRTGRRVGKGCDAKADERCQCLGTQLCVAPPINRASMVPEPWGALNPLVRWCQGSSVRSARRVEGNISSGNDAGCTAMPVRAGKAGRAASSGAAVPDAGPNGACHFLHESRVAVSGNDTAGNGIAALFALLVLLGFGRLLDGDDRLSAAGTGKDQHLISTERR
jgi:membrane glycosyltransferase